MFFPIRGRSGPQYPPNETRGGSEGNFDRNIGSISRRRLPSAVLLPHPSLRKNPKKAFPETQSEKTLPYIFAIRIATRLNGSRPEKPCTSVSVRFDARTNGGNPIRTLRFKKIRRRQRGYKPNLHKIPPCRTCLRQGGFSFLRAGWTVFQDSNVAHVMPQSNHIFVCDASISLRSVRR